MSRGLGRSDNWEWNGMRFRTLADLCLELKVSPATVHRHCKGLTTKPSSLNLRVHPIKKIKLQ